MGWIVNSCGDFNNALDHNAEFCLCVLAVAICILLHSFWVHGWNFKRVRLIVDIGCLGAIVTCIGTYIGIAYPTQYNIAFGIDLLGYGVGNSTIVVCDALMTYSRHKVLRSDYFRYQDQFVYTYIFLLLFGMSFPYYSIVPFAFNCADAEVLGALNICLWYILVPAVTLYNVYFTQCFLSTIVSFYRSKLERHPSLLILAFKSLIHCCISISANYWQSFTSLTNPIQGEMGFTIMILVTIHVMFNSNWDLFDIMDKMRAPSKNQVEVYDFMDGVKYENLDMIPRNKQESSLVAIQGSSNNDTNMVEVASKEQHEVVRNLEAGVASSGSNKSIQHDHQISNAISVSGVINPVHGRHPLQQIDGHITRGDGEAIVVARNYGFM